MFSQLTTNVNVFIKIKVNKSSLLLSKQVRKRAGGKSRCRERDETVRVMMGEGRIYHIKQCVWIRNSFFANCAVSYARVAWT